MIRNAVRWYDCVAYLLVLRRSTMHVQAEMWTSCRAVGSIDNLAAAEEM